MKNGEYNSKSTACDNCSNKDAIRVGAVSSLFSPCGEFHQNFTITLNGRRMISSSITRSRVPGLSKQSVNSELLLKTC